MIFVVLGTQDKPFDRLLKVIEDAKRCGVIEDEIIVQAGETNFNSEVLDIRKIIPMDEFNKLIEESSLVICHAGYGILSTALEKQKKIICAARLAEYGEHQNNHQLDILNYYESKNFILALRDFSKFFDIYEKSKNFVPVKYNSSFTNLQNLITNYIDSH